MRCACLFSAAIALISVAVCSQADANIQLRAQVSAQTHQANVDAAAAPQVAGEWDVSQRRASGYAQGSTAARGSLRTAISSVLDAGLDAPAFTPCVSLGLVLAHGALSALASAGPLRHAAQPYGALRGLSPFALGVAAALVVLVRRAGAAVAACDYGRTEDVRRLNASAATHMLLCFLVHTAFFALFALVPGAFAEDGVGVHAGAAAFAASQALAVAYLHLTTARLASAAGGVRVHLALTHARPDVSITVPAQPAMTPLRGADAVNEVAEENAAVVALNGPTPQPHASDGARAASEQDAAAERRRDRKFEGRFQVYNYLDANYLTQRPI